MTLWPSQVFKSWTSCSIWRANFVHVANCSQKADKNIGGSFQRVCAENFFLNWCQPPLATRNIRSANTPFQPAYYGSIEWFHRARDPLKIALKVGKSFWQFERILPWITGKHWNLWLDETSQCHSKIPVILCVRTGRHCPQTVVQVARLSETTERSRGNQIFRLFCVKVVQKNAEIFLTRHALYRWSRTVSDN